MSELNYKFFIYIGFKKFIFSALDENDKDFFSKEINLDDNSFKENLVSLNKFLSSNIILFEKKYHFHVKDINLIIDYNEFIILDISTTNNFNNVPNLISDNSNYLFNIKDYINKNMSDYNLIHMIISKFIVNGNKYLTLPNNIDNKKVFLEIKFILLSNKILEDLKKVFSNYEILVRNTLYYNYVVNFKNLETNNIFVIASRLLKGVNKKEIFYTKRPAKNLSFFEKFFKFFN